MQTTAPEMYAEWSKNNTISIVSGLSIGAEVCPFPLANPLGFLYLVYANPDAETSLWDFDPLFVKDDKKERKIARLQGKLDKLQGQLEKI